MDTLQIIGSILGFLTGTGIIAFVFHSCFKIGKYSEKFTSMKTSLQNIENSTKSIDKDLTNVNNATAEIQSHLEGSGFKILHSLTMKPGSPLVLTDYGERLIRESGFYETFKDENKRKIINAVKAHSPQTNYDIQECSKDALLKDLINDPMMKPIKDYAFRKSTNIKLILEAAALVVRDEVMKELKFDNNL